MTQNLEDRFGGIARVYGKENLLKINQAKVLIVGLGGVGSWAVEALARSGVGHLTLCDFDDICVSNTNRQLHAMTGEIGRLKTESLKDRVTKINPEIEVHIIDQAFKEHTEEEIFQFQYDCVIDAIDHAHTKFFLARACHQRHIKEVIVGSAGGRLDPSKIKVADLSKAEEDTLLAMVRKDLRRQAGLPRKDRMGVACVYSTEKPRYPLGDNSFTTKKPEEFKKPLDCATGFGTLTHITGTFGFFAVHACLRNIIGDD